jgi:hypothetical protein
MPKTTAPRSVAGPNTSKVQKKMVKRTRSQSPPSAVSKAEVERRRKNPNLRDEQIDIGRRTNKRIAERRQKDLARAGARDLAAQRAGRKAGEAASNRVMRAAAKGVARGLGAVPAAALTGAELLEDYVVKPAAEKAKAERGSYNERAGTNRTTSRRSTRQAMDNTRLDRLRARDMTGVEMKKGGKVRGCGMARKGVRPARMV